MPRSATTTPTSRSLFDFAPHQKGNGVNKPSPRPSMCLQDVVLKEYPICSIRLVDDFDADDEASMEANNTSCFNYRTVPGTSVLPSSLFASTSTPCKTPISEAQKCILQQQRNMSTERRISPTKSTKTTCATRSLPRMALLGAEFGATKTTSTSRNGDKFF